MPQTNVEPKKYAYIYKKDIKAMSEQGTSAVGGASATKEDLFKEWSTDRSGWTATKEAKQLYFLSTGDLAYLQCHVSQAWGWYRTWAAYEMLQHHGSYRGKSSKAWK